jgi:hypothetical protein
MKEKNLSKNKSKSVFTKIKHESKQPNDKDVKLKVSESRLNLYDKNN